MEIQWKIVKRMKISRKIIMDENLAIDFDNNDDYENLNLFQLKIL